MNRESQSTTVTETISPIHPSDWTQATDSQLIEACLAGHETAWAVLIQRYSRLIYTIPLRFGFPKMIADEVFQEACLILLEGLPALQDRQRISSWLMTVTRRACIQRLRRRPLLETDELTEAKQAVESTIEEDLLRLEQQQMVQEALAKLPARDQKLLWALFMEEPRRPYAQIARELQIPEGSIGPLRARSLKKLHQEIMRLERLR